MTMNKLCSQYFHDLPEFELQNMTLLLLVLKISPNIRTYLNLNINVKVILDVTF